MPVTKEKQTSQKFRQPIVAVMGHVDHGKTTFLDAIRDTNVASKEHGGITQNTRSHEVVTKSGNKITFIDTPGHEAFSKMRSRGARVTDFVLLMVAADDGLQPQTKESIKFAKENNVPIIVAINKIDLPGINIQKIKQELASFDVQVEEYGGEVMSFEISALNKIGLDELIEGIELLSEVNELKNREPKEGVVAEAFVMESQLDKNTGYSAMAILKAGQINDRLFGATENQVFKVRAYKNESGKQVSNIYLSQPFTIIGLSNDLPTGEIINFVNTEKEAKQIQAELQQGNISEDVEAEESDVETLFAQMLIAHKEVQEGVQQKELPVILKSSTQGTLEAIVTELDKLETEESKIKIVQQGTGDITPADIDMAKVTKGIVLAFQLNTKAGIMQLARQERVLVRNYEIIYELVDEVAEVLDSMDKPMEEEIEMSKAKVKQVFSLSNGDQVAGSEVIDNKFIKGYRVKVIRGDKELGRTKITSVRQGKNEVKEVKKGNDCGLLLSPAIEDLQEGDVIVAFRVEKY